MLSLPFIHFTSFEQSQGKDKDPKHKGHNGSSLNKTHPITEYILRIRRFCGKDQQDNPQRTDESQSKRPPLEKLPIGIFTKTAQKHKTTAGHEGKDNPAADTVHCAVKGHLVCGCIYRVHHKRSREKIADGKGSEND